MKAIIGGEWGSKEVDIQLSEKSKKELEEIKRGIEQKASAIVWCRECGMQMKQYPYNILAYSCQKCKLRARVIYEKMPVIIARGAKTKPKKNEPNFFQEWDEAIKRHMR